MIGLWITLGYFAVVFGATRLGYANYIDYLLTKRGRCVSHCETNYHSSYCTKDRDFSPRDRAEICWYIFCSFGIALFWPLTGPLALIGLFPSRVQRLQKREAAVKQKARENKLEQERLAQLRKELNF